MCNGIKWVHLTTRFICLCMQRLSEICCSAVSQLLMLAKSITSSANKAQDEDVDEGMVQMDWPEDSVEKAKIIRTRAQSMTVNVEAVCNSFITGMFTRHYFFLVFNDGCYSQPLFFQIQPISKYNSFFLHAT